MNFAFPALVILAFALPGIFCRSAYRQRATRFQARLGDLTSEIAVGLFISVFIHLGLFQLFKYLVEHLTETHCTFDFILELLAGNNLDQHYSDATRDFASHFPEIGIYFILSIIVGWGLGFICHRLIHNYRLDILFHPFFHIHDKWFYLFTGLGEATSSLKTSEFSYKQIREFCEDECPCVVSLLMEIAEKPQIYFGVVVAYELNSDGHLDQLTLKQVIRIEMPPSPINLNSVIHEYTEQYLKFFAQEDGEAIFRDVGLFVIPYANVLNMNIRFPFDVVELDELPPEEGIYEDGTILDPLLRSKKTTEPNTTEITQAASLADAGKNESSREGEKHSSPPTRGESSESEITVTVATAQKLSITIQTAPPKPLNDGKTSQPSG